MAGRHPADAPGGLGFGLKWNMGWMHDSLDYVAAGAGVPQLPPPPDDVLDDVRLLRELRAADQPRRGRARQGLAAAQDAGRPVAAAGERARLPGLMWAHPGKQLLFMGPEFGQEGEWTECRSLDWWLLDNPGHRGVVLLVSELNPATRSRRALVAGHRPGGFPWIDANDAPGNVSRSCASAPVWTPATESVDGGQAHGSALACVANFAGTPHEGYRIGLPCGRHWSEVLNTDAPATAAGVGNSAPSRPATRGGTASRRRPPCACRRSGPSGVCTRGDRAGSRGSGAPAPPAVGRACVGSASAGSRPVVPTTACSARAGCAATAGHRLLPPTLRWSRRPPAHPGGERSSRGGLRSPAQRHVIDELARNALADLEAFWAEPFPEVFGEEFTAARRAATSASTPTASDPARLPRDGVGCGLDSGRGRQQRLLLPGNARYDPISDADHLRPGVPRRAGRRLRASSCRRW